jgi:predicted dehydrogenase/threonine dehydrogenase-like Zn-dependent dehydrogenase
MKQILQNLKNGNTELMDVPPPKISKKKILIQTNQSLLSLGTEKMLVSFGKASLVNKAIQQPDKVKQALNKISTDGVVSTIATINNKLNVPIPLGYCNVGTIIDCGDGIQNFKKGDRVVSNGPHAEIVSVSNNLCAVIPESVTNDQASFVVPGAIALNGVRLANPTLGEYFVVFGLGLIGLLTIQILRAHGCKVLGIDFDESKLKLAKHYGAEIFNPNSDEDLVSRSLNFSHNSGIDGVLICASSNDDSLIHQSALISRKRGRIILIGTTGLKLLRDDFYEKELTFQVSCSYGPGRYDQSYEEHGIDYPIGFVRWTEQRNFLAILQLLKEGKINVDQMISRKFPFEDANDAYELIDKPNNFLGLIFEYSQSADISNTNLIQRSLKDSHSSARESKDNLRVSFLGAGQYASSVLIPMFKKTQVVLNTISSQNGLSAAFALNKFSFLKAGTSNQDIINDEDTDAVVISTRHDSHADLVVDCIDAGKHIFVEKPLCINIADLDRIIQTKQSSDENRILMVGFNRRFSPHIQKVYSLLSEITSPKSFVMNVNAGSLDKEHWLNNLKQGGGRLIGETCHFVDLIRFLANSSIIASSVISSSNCNDSHSIHLKFLDGSIGVINYFVNGHQSIPKERLEIFVDNKVLFLDNYKTLSGVGWKSFKKFKTWKQEKGQKECVHSFVSSIQSSYNPPIPFEEIVEVMQVCINLSDQIN